MRLLVIVNVFDPDLAGGGAIFTDLCMALAERGHAVTVRCAYPYYPEWTDKSGNNGLRIRRYEKQGVHVERYGIFIPRNPNSLFQRLLYEASFLASLLRSLPRGRRHDAVMVFCPLVGAVAFSVLNKWLFRKPLWLNVQDLSADAAAASGISRGGAATRLLAGVQNWLFNRTDIWSSISPVMIERLKAVRRNGQPILYFPNWLHSSLAGRIKKLPSKLDRSPNRPLQLLYAGNLGAKQGLLEFLQILAASPSEFIFRIHGSGSGAGAIREWITRTRDDRFRFGPFLDEDGFTRFLHDADLFVITEKPGSGGSFMPSKMIPAMAAGTPILAVSDPTTPLGEEMRACQPGPWLSWERVEEIPSLLQYLTSADSDRQGDFRTWRQNAVARAAFYDRDRTVNHLDAALKAVIAGTNPEAVADRLLRTSGPNTPRN